MKIKVTKQDLFVIQQLAHKDKSRENASSFFGQLWQILNPFINMIVLILVFSTMFANKDFVNYPMFVATGTMIFDIFSSGTKSCLGALVANKNFLIKAQLDKTVYLKERIYVTLINFTYSFIIYLGLMMWFRIPFKGTMLLLIPDLFLLVMMVYGFGKILAIVNALFADIRYFHDIFVLMFFYGSALFYDPQRLDYFAQKVLSFNPVYISIAIARISILDGYIPKWTLWAKLLLYSVFFYSLGSYVFKKGSQNIVAKI